MVRTKKIEQPQARMQEDAEFDQMMDMEHEENRRMIMEEPTARRLTVR